MRPPPVSLVPRLLAPRLLAPCLLAALAVAGAAAPLRAAPISYTFSGVATGSLGGAGFAAAPVQFVLSTDTSTVVQLPIPVDILVTADTVLSFTVAGVSGTFSSPFHVFRNADVQSVGLSPLSGNDLVSLRTASFAPYDLVAAFGPFTQVPPDFLNIGEAYATSAGDLVFTSDDDASITFQATLEAAAVPEPGSLLLLGTGVAGLLVRARRGRGAAPAA